MKSNFLNWAEKYRPATLDEIIGNNKAIDELKKWAINIEKGRKAVILYGPPGVGKTSAALALARDMNWDVIELNASDERTAEVIKRCAGEAAKAGTFSGVAGKRLIILDEADNIHGTADRGGAKAIVEVVKESNQPIILIANDLYALSPVLRGLCKAIQFKPIQSREIVSVLRRICEREGIKCDETALLAIAEKCTDLRSAINDLQAIAQGKDSISIEDVVVGKRDVKETIFQVLAEIFKGRKLTKPLYAAYSLDESPEDLIHWIDENLPREYKNEDLKRGFEALSKADIFLGRVKRRQRYALWRFASELMICGTQNAKSSDYSYKGYTPYSSPTFWRKLAQTKTMREIRDSIAEKIARYCHTSQQYVRSEILPFFRILMSKKELAVKISAILQLEEEEIAFLLNLRSDSKIVKEIHQAAQALIAKQVEEHIEASLSSEERGSIEAEEMQKKQRTLFEF
ncbi:MAG: replication factor C large subunit [Methanocellales archaeon]